VAVELSLVLPCYNEEPWLANSIAEIVKVLDSTGLEYELILVDDASRDGTRKAIEGIVKAYPGKAIKTLFHAQNTGWGRAVADGIRETSGEVAGFLDVDLEVHPRYAVECFNAVKGGASVAVGSRIHRFVARGLLRRLLSVVFAALVRLLLPAIGPDNLASGCKFFRRVEILPLLDIVRDDGWFWDLEMMVRCRLAGLSIALVPCEYVRNTSKPSSVRIFHDGFESLRKLIAFRGELRRSGQLYGRMAARHP
jgi:glycosyltransferase involved in cell wall biosynthesis